MRAVLRLFFFFSSRRRHTRCSRDWSSDVCSSDLIVQYQQYPFVSGSFAPYRLTIARPHDRVTDETAPVTPLDPASPDRKSTRLNSSHGYISYAVFCLKKKNNDTSPHLNHDTAYDV